MTHRTALEAAERVLERITARVHDGVPDGNRYSLIEVKDLRQAREALALVKAALAEDEVERLREENRKLRHDIAEEAAETDEDSTYTPINGCWQCFHCGKVFYTEAAAKLHFGTTDDDLPVCCRVEEFAKAILHGDNDHREWLAQAARCFVAGLELPEVTGKGRAEAAEARVKELEATVARLDATIENKALVSRDALARAEKAESQLALPVAGEVERAVRWLESWRDFPTDVRMTVDEGIIERTAKIAALLRRFGRVPKLETDAEVRKYLAALAGPAYGRTGIYLAALLRDIDAAEAFLSRIRADGATEVE